MFDMTGFLQHGEDRPKHAGDHPTHPDRQLSESVAYGQYPAGTESTA